MIISVLVRISIFLSFYFYLPRDTHTARRTRKKTEQRSWVEFFVWLAIPRLQNSICFVKKFFSNNRCMLAFIDFSCMAKLPVINRVCDDCRDARNITSIIFP